MRFRVFMGFAENHKRGRAQIAAHISGEVRRRIPSSLKCGFSIGEFSFEPAALTLVFHTLSS
jgi:hypothetical protein